MVLFLYLESYNGKISLKYCIKIKNFRKKLMDKLLENTFWHSIHKSNKLVEGRYLLIIKRWFSKVLFIKIRTLMCWLCNMQKIAWSRKKWTIYRILQRFYIWEVSENHFNDRVKDTLLLN